MGIEKPFGRRTTPPEDPHTKEVKEKLDSYRELTAAVNELTSLTQGNEQRKTFLEQEMVPLELVYDAVRTNAENPDFSSLPQDVLEQIGELDSHTRLEIEDILRKAMEARSEEIRSMIQVEQVTKTIQNKRERLGGKDIQQAPLEEE